MPSETEDSQLGLFDVDEYIDERLKKRVHPETERGLSDRCPNCGSGWHGRPERDCKGSHLSKAEANGED